MIKLLNAMMTVNYLPGIIAPLAPLCLPGAAIPTSWWNPGLDFPWLERFNLYKRYNSETISFLPWLIGSPSIYTSNLDVARQLVAGGVKSTWIKPESASMTLLLWGMNLAAAEKETWRRHRRIMGPAFNNKTYALVWDRTIKTYHDMITTEGWSDSSITQVDVPNIQKLSLKFALLVIAACGFGVNTFTWSDPPTGESGEMSIQESLRIVSETNLFAASAPKWVWKLPIGWIRDVGKAHKTLDAFMHAQVAERRMEVRSGFVQKNDVFSMLVRANEDDNGKFPLDDSELIGNIFVLLFAGHETTANTLAATLGFLGLYQDIQDEVVQQILDVVGQTQDPTFEQYNSLYKVLGAFYEALRMFPSGSLLIRESIEDTVLTLPKPLGEEGSKTWPIPKGIWLVVDMIGIQYNPRYFSEPEKYKPSRWYEGETSEEADIFTAFSIGPRQCIGRRFATTEAVAFLTIFLRDWKVEPLLNDGETNEEWKERVMQGKMILILQIGDVPIRFTRRVKKVY
jgi:cytochrome P450